MGKILITRSEPGASALGQVLQQHGFEVICAPLVKIVDVVPANILQLNAEATALPAAPAADPDVVIFLSAHATRRFVEQGWLHRIKASSCLAVGAASAELLREHGLVVEVPEQNTTEGLLEMGVLKQLTRQHSVWLIAGVGGRATLAQTLIRQQRCGVVKFELYRRLSLDLPAVDVDAVSAVVVSSAGSLEMLAQQWPASKQLPVVVPSARLAAIARTSGFQQVQVAHNASAQATLDILQPLKAVKRLQ